MAEKKRWSDLSGRQRGGIIAAGTVQISLMIAALADLRRRSAKQINGPKPAWVAASFVNFFGPIAYFVLGRKR